VAGEIKARIESDRRLGGGTEMAATTEGGGARRGSGRRALKSGCCRTGGMGLGSKKGKGFSKKGHRYKAGLAVRGRS